MSTVVKIRILVLVLTLCFAGTATTINLTFDKVEVLAHDAKQIQQQLHEKEQFVWKYLADSANFSNLKRIDRDPIFAEETIEYFVDKHNIYIYTYLNNVLTFWGSNIYVPSTDAGMPNGTSVIQVENGWYLSTKASQGNFSVVFLLPIKSEFAKNNAFLKDQFNPKIIRTNNLDIGVADDDNLVYNVRNMDGAYLFSLHLKEVDYDTWFSKLELIMWLLAGFSLTFLVGSLCLMLAKRNYAWLSILLFGAFLLLFRYFDLNGNLLAANFRIGIFDPKNFASSAVFPHLGGFILNIIVIAWFVGYMFMVKQFVKFHASFHSNLKAISTVFVLGTLPYLFARQIGHIFAGLVSNSNINFDMVNILNLSEYSWLGIFGLCLSMFSLLLFTDFIVNLSIKLLGSVKKVLLVYVLSGLVMMGFNFIERELTLAFLLVFLLVQLRVMNTVWRGKFDLAIFISSLMLLAGLSALKNNEFQSHRKQEVQKLAIQKLEAVDDANALTLFFDLEREIVEDDLLSSFFFDDQVATLETLQEHLKKTYFSGYLSKYDIEINLFDNDLRPVGMSSQQKAVEYRDKVISGALKVFDNLNFYRGDANFGNFEYFAQLPVLDDVDGQIGVMLIVLKNRSFTQVTSYPEILSDSRIEQLQTETFSQYSYSFYTNGELVSQFGEFVYPISDESYPNDLRLFVRVPNEGGFNHMIYRPNSENLIVLSKPQLNNWMHLASWSFIFLVFLFFAILGYGVAWVFVTLESNDFSIRNLRWHIMLLFNRVLYSTRIHTLLVFFVVITLITAGLITFWSISSQYRVQQNHASLQHVSEIAKGIELRMANNDQYLQSGRISHEQFNLLSEATATDLNLYDREGTLLYSTQPRIFDLRLISTLMDPRAWLHIAKLGRSEYVHDERIGNMNFITAYAPIKNERYEPLAFLSLPYFANQKEFDQNVGHLLNTLINIYALVILVLGVFAVFAANKITEPLMLVQRSLAKTTIGKQNEPIFWKYNDEIGSLIKEYNLMILALEQSANQIVKSERESAWREMAKQVAHEIKNPLTPLKLGMQQLQRSWTDKDPNFEQKFKRFYESFIDQIDGLTHIATEFSAYAKMPDTELERLDVLDVISSSCATFSANKSVAINLHNDTGDSEIYLLGDRRQMLGAFNNLIKNALEASFGKRKCRIDIIVSYDIQGNTQIEIKDNGQGIDPEARKKLFQPNFTTKSSGTGLGLAFVKGAIDSVNGSITYKTVLGKGTSFYIVVPKVS